jgi:hypothetical protein
MRFLAPSFLEILSQSKTWLPLEQMHTAGSIGQDRIIWHSSLEILCLGVVTSMVNTMFNTYCTSGLWLGKKSMRKGYDITGC